MAASQSLMVTAGSEQQNLLALNLELFSRSTQLLSPTSTDHSTKVSQPMQNKTAFPPKPSQVSQSSQLSHNTLTDWGKKFHYSLSYLLFRPEEKKKVPHSAKSDSKNRVVGFPQIDRLL